MEKIKTYTWKITNFALLSSFIHILNQGVNSLHECSWNRHLLTLYIIASICFSKHSINDQVESRRQSGVKFCQNKSQMMKSQIFQ